MTRDGGVVTSFGVVRVGRSESLLERRAEIERLAEEVARLEAEAALAVTEAAEAAVPPPRRGPRWTRRAKRSVGPGLPAAKRRRPSDGRPERWRRGPRGGLALGAGRASRGRPGSVAGGRSPRRAGPAGPGVGRRHGRSQPPRRRRPRQGHAGVGGPRASLRARRDQLAAEEAALEAARREAEARRARAAAAANLDRERIAGLERQTAELAGRERQIGAERESLGEELAAAAMREAAVRAELERLRAAASAARTRLAEAEAAASQSRERLRVCQDGARSAEVAELEARLALDSIREQVLVELAGLGDLGLRLLAMEGEAGAGDQAIPERYIPEPGSPPTTRTRSRATQLEAALARRPRAGCRVAG